ncbi:Endoplasmic reticulum mannosyl-oligosaccharide 1,2-alpha-mannosidase [Cytospora mali]|uniref:alpha-1,2-Mannosidase n=1 Tax=Cytospora mali TaxID=578113 RepID=A0A194W8F5_CYTMA|nr:Endoplasmic reticulum mannosyl-oligosaccharide 1,2-alpha-mannosidase [Valsa mali]
MLRLRRYRVFVACAVFLVFLLYRTSVNSGWDNGSQYEHDAAQANTERKATNRDPVQMPLHEQESFGEEEVKIPELETVTEAKDGFALPTPIKSEQDNEALLEPPATTDPPVVVIPDRKPGQVGDAYLHKAEDPLHIQNPPGRVQDETITPTSTIYWTQPPERFPVDSLISLPTGKPKPVPKVQYSFGSEDADAKIKREGRLEQVKAEMKHAWGGYVKFAFGHDELTPISNDYADPFAGWGATLVDAMDTLWIMGLKEEFNEAYRGLEDIDFTTTPYRKDIPVFETTIRYLGGLLAAYDVTGGHKGDYPLLLKKAVELAEILMGIFDTPNRMPDLHYRWKPAYAFQPKRASTHSGIAELASLSMEFTRLAQLTGKDKYYDGIARITDALEEWQNREDGTAPAIPGIFPENVDASGCNRTATNALREASDLAKKQAADAILEEPKGYVPPVAGSSGAGYAATEERPNVEFQVTPGSAGSPETGGFKEIGKRGVDDGVLPVEAPSGNTRQTFKRRPPPPFGGSRFENHDAVKPLDANGLPADWECIAQNLTASSGVQKFSMGGSQDSAYEYFPKEWLLLGGLEPKYRTMHEKTVAAVKEWLLYRPMVPGDPDILFSAQATLSSGQDLNRLAYVYEVTHLTCFLGGMFGLGAKIFDVPEDLEIGKRLTDGCVWAYSAMPSGIMPESAHVVPCPDAYDCHWNETVWTDEYLDPDPEWRQKLMDDYVGRLKTWEAEKQQAIRQEAERLQAAEEIVQREQGQAERKPGVPVGYNGLRGRSDETAAPPLDPSTLDQNAIKEKMRILEAELNFNEETTGRAQISGSSQLPIGEAAIKLPQRPVKPMTHEQYVAQRITTEDILPGFTLIGDRRYILRPEAIESVWYMYRITGDPIWQDKGWKMWQAIVKHTHTEYGNAAIDHVNNKDGVTTPEDKMESFWLAETLKYFYLLYSDPDLISLDDWVLNTEAHPFRRPT